MKVRHLMNGPGSRSEIFFFPKNIINLGQSFVCTLLMWDFPSAQHDMHQVHMCEPCLTWLHDGTDVCVDADTCTGRHDGGSAQRDKRSNLSSPSHSQPSFQTSQSCTFRFSRHNTRTTTYTYTHWVGASLQTWAKLSFQSTSKKDEINPIGPRNQRDGHGLNVIYTVIALV